MATELIAPDQVLVTGALGRWSGFEPGLREFVAAPSAGRGSRLHIEPGPFDLAVAATAPVLDSFFRHPASFDRRLGADVQDTGVRDQGALAHCR